MANSFGAAALSSGLLAAVLAVSVCAEPVVATAREKNSPHLTFCCSEQNDVFNAVSGRGVRPARHDTPESAIENAPPKSGVLLLADGYPESGPRVSADALAKAKAKGLRLYVEYPDALPGLTFEEPRTA